MPTSAQVHVDAALTDFAAGQYFQDASNYVWHQASPLIGVSKQSDRYHVWSRADLLRSDTRKRAPGTKAARRDWGLSNNPYFADVRAIAHAISEQTRANADPSVNLETSVTRGLMQDMHIALEVDWAATFFVTGVWGTSNAAQNWSDAASTPIEAIATAKGTVLGNTGFEPNTLVLGYDGWRVLMNHPDVIGRLPDNAPRIGTPGFLGNLLGFERVLICTAVRNTAQEGATASYSFVDSDHALVCYVDPNPGTDRPTAMGTFNWTGFHGASNGVRVQRQDIPDEDALPLITVESALDFRVVASELGYWFGNVSS